MSAAKKTIEELVHVNPLIDSRGDTMAVSVALKFLSKTFADTDPDAPVELGYDECFGLSLLLQTCAAALDVMKGGAQ